MSRRLSHWFNALPEPMQRLLAVGSVGKLHLLDTVAQGLAHATPTSGPSSSPPSRQDTPDLTSLLADMMLTAYADTPLSGELASRILATPALVPCLDDDSRTLMRTVARQWHRPENMNYFRRIVQRRDTDKVKLFLEQQIAREPENLFWREQAAHVGMYEADHDWLRSCLSDPFLKDLGDLHSGLMAQIELAAGNAPGAEKCAAKAGETFGTGWQTLFAARCRLLAGDRDAGLALLLETLALHPWQTQAALAAHDIITSVDTALAPLPGSVAVLLYSWNKADDLNDALASLHGSDLGKARIFALDNGSSDETGDILRQWQERFTPERMEVISLPVNVGAAAARNWLMHLPEVRASEFCVYLDDDAILPPDWLLRLGAAVEHYPEAGVWGCKVVDAHQTTRIQAVDYHLKPLLPEQRMDLTRVSPHEIRLSNLHIQVLDQGQFDYLRPCASVTGCCHLFRTAELLETGDFSLFLSPSQYDDMERDLRMLAAGRTAVYQGHLRVQHRKSTGRAALLETTQEATSLGNRYKMCVMHEPEEIARSTGMEQEVVLKDLRTKLMVLDQNLS